MNSLDRKRQHSAPSAIEAPLFANADCVTGTFQASQGQLQFQQAEDARYLLSEDAEPDADTDEQCEPRTEYDEASCGEPEAKRKKTKGRVKISVEFIEHKARRFTTFSKRKTGLMKKAYELATLTGAQVMLLVASETGHVYTFATRKLQSMITSESGKALIQTCLNSPDSPTPLASQSPAPVAFPSVVAVETSPNDPSVFRFAQESENVFEESPSDPRSVPQTSRFRKIAPSGPSNVNAVVNTSAGWNRNGSMVANGMLQTKFVAATTFHTPEHAKSPTLSNV